MELSDLASIQDLPPCFGRREPSPYEEFSHHTPVLRSASNHLPGSVTIGLTMILVALKTENSKTSSLIMSSVPKRFKIPVSAQLSSLEAPSAGKMLQSYAESP